MSGMKDCVGKPFTSQELWRCLIKYFKPLSWQPVNETQQNALAESEFLHELMIDFAKDNQTKFSEIAGYIRAGDIKTAHRLAHTLKSSAAYLGKTLLQKAAEDVEQHLKDGKNLVTPQQMVVLETELGAVLAELAPLLDMRKNDERN
jgi:HPt (histidine-containing phosphotransfer) domain-containing protein